MEVDSIVKNLREKNKSNKDNYSFGNEIVGSLAGEDTIIVIMSCEKSAKALCEELLTIIK